MKIIVYFEAAVVNQYGKDFEKAIGVEVPVIGQLSAAACQGGVIFNNKTSVVLYLSIEGKRIDNIEIIRVIENF